MSKQPVARSALSSSIQPAVADRRSHAHAVQFQPTAVADEQTPTAVTDTSAVAEISHAERRAQVSVVAARHLYMHYVC